MDNLIKNRSEILFLYDVVDNNPNGDPMDENKPRIDEETGTNIVTDVRLKRTIRDYLHYFKNKDVFVLGIRDDNGDLKTKETKLKEIKKENKKITDFIDIRLFGGTIAVKKQTTEQNETSTAKKTNNEQTITLTGPVQFKFGRSLHKVDLTYIKGTTVMPSGEGRGQGTFTEKYILPYSLICFYGIVNENAATNQNLNTTEEDIELLLEGMWNGTKNLITCSKIGHTPRLLMQVIYKESNYHIGELDKRVRIRSDKPDIAIRDISDLKLDITELLDALKNNKDNIKEIKFKLDNRVTLEDKGQQVDLQKQLQNEGLNVTALNF